MIDINDWVLSGGGAQGDTYIHKYDSCLLLKLFSEGTDIDIIKNEIETAKAVKDCGISCPAPGEFISCGNRHGIILQRIENKKSFCRAMADDPGCIPDIAARFSRMGLDLHSKSSEGTAFISEIVYYRSLLDKCHLLSDEMRARMQKALDLVQKEETKTLLHGDYHFGNIITDGKNDYFIDLGNFAYGNEKFDNSLLYLTCNITPEPTLLHFYHIDRTVALSFWKEYKETYFGGAAPSDKDLYQSYLPYLLLRTLFFLDVSGNHPDIIRMMDSFAGDFDRMKSHD